MARKTDVKFDITAKDKTKTAFASASSGLRALRGTASKLAVPGLVGASVIAGLGLFAKKAIEVADTLAKTADQIGISTDALQEYRHASELAGVDVGALDTSFRKFTRTIGELRAGTGAAVTFLAKFRPELVKQFRATRNADDALELLFDTLGGVANQSDRAALAAAFFGRKGAELTLLVKDGSEALKEQRQRAHELGLVLEEDLLRAAERTNDQLSILANTMKTNLYRAVLQITPQLGDLAERLSDSIPALVKWVDEFAQFIGLIKQSRFDKLDELNAKLAEFEERLNTPGSRRYYQELEGRAMAKLEAEIAELEGLILYSDTRTAATFGGSKSKGGSGKGAGGSADPAAADIAEARKKKLAEERILTAALVKEMNAWKTAEDATTAARETANQKIQDQNANVARTIKGMREENLLLNLTLDGRTDLAATLRAEIQLRDQIGRELLPTERAELEKLVLEQERLNEKLDESGEKWQEFADLGQEAFASLEGGVEGFASFMLNNLDTILEKLGEFNDFAGSTGGGGGWLEGLFSVGASVFGGSMSSGSTNFMASNTGGYQFPQFASGGAFTVGGRGGTDNNLVQFKASADERVTIETPAQMRSRLKGGAAITNHYVIDARGADQSGLARLEQTIRQLNGSIEKRALAAVSDGVARNKIPGLG